jgi:large subunit ribosomal protein L13
VIKYTRSTTTAEAQADRKWWIVDLEGVTLGRAATRIAHVLRGKHKPTYTPHVDTGDFVIIVNAEKVAMTGQKLDQKTYFRHTGFVGGIREVRAKHLLERDPEKVIRKAVKGMLPRGPLGRQQMRKLKIHVGSEHPHQAQQAKPLPLD